MKLNWKLLALLVIVFGVFVRSYRPDSQVLPLFNSDAAIPVLMANHDGLSLFDAYYWGQDRFGSLPFLILRAAGSVMRVFSHVEWTPANVQVWLILWVFAGAASFALLFPENKAAALAFFVLLVSCPFFDRHMFEIAQFFPWQLFPLFGALALIRRLESASLLWFLAAGGAVFLAVWASPLNLLFIISFTCIEAWHDRSSGNHSALRAAIVRVSAAAAGTGLERLLRAAFHSENFTIYGNEYRTMSWINRSEIPAAAAELAARMVESPGLLLLDAAGIAALAYGLRRLGKGPVPPGVRAATTAGIGALLQLPLLVSVHHFTVSGYPDRFFFLLHFGLAASLLAVLPILPEAFRRYAPLAALLFAAALAARAGVPNPAFADVQNSAAAVCREGQLLAGSYWQTYVYAAHGRRCRPFPHDGVNRMPWIRPAHGDRGILVVSEQQPFMRPMRVTAPVQTSGSLRYAPFIWEQPAGTDER